MAVSPCLFFSSCRQERQIREQQHNALCVCVCVSLSLFSLSVCVKTYRVCTVLDEQLHNFRVAIHGGVMQWGHIIQSLGIDLRVCVCVCVCVRACVCV